MKLFQSIAGTLSLEITSADIPQLLKNMNEAQIELYDLMHTGALSVCVQIKRSDYRRLRILSEKNGASVRLNGKGGIYWRLRDLVHRPVLVSGILLLFFLVAWLPTRVLFITVEGNITVPTALILEKADGCGISFGASRREVRSEKMKNSLLAAIPQLQWAGINTVGCTAVVSVEEREVQMQEARKHGVSSIVAVRDGIILSCTITRGNALCRIGQAVKAGQILVSGYTDCGISIQAQRSEGEIFAQTLREIRVATPLSYTQRGNIRREYKKISLLIGKKRIIFCKDSGISGAVYDKMYKEYYVTLPGGFQLPVALVVETWSEYEDCNIPAASNGAQDTAADFAQSYLLRKMISGQILGSTATYQSTEDVCILYGRYICSEMIGREQSEEIIKYDGENH